MTTTWRQVARKDVADAARSHMLWGVVGVFVAVMGLVLVIAPVAFPIEESIDVEMALAFVAELAQLFVPVVALITGYLSVVGERRAGSLRVLLSYPFSRFDLVAGKLVGRAIVIGTALLAGLAIMLGLAVVRYGAPPVGVVVGIAGATLLFGLAFTGLAVGVSAGTDTRGRAMATVLGIYLVCLVFWDAIAAGIYYVIHGALPSLEVEAWYLLLVRLNPVEAFRALVDAALEPPVASAFTIPIEDVPQDATPEQLAVANRVAGELPVYLTDWFLVVVLLAWAVVPVAIGYWRFTRADLDG